MLNEELKKEEWAESAIDLNSDGDLLLQKPPLGVDDEGSGKELHFKMTVRLVFSLNYTHLVSVSYLLDSKVWLLAANIKPHSTKTSLPFRGLQMEMFLTLKQLVIDRNQVWAWK